MNHLFRKLVFCLTFACMVGASAAASYAADQAITREDIENRRQEIVVATMKFSDEQLKQKFLEVYVPYQEKLMKIMKGREKLLIQFLQDEKNGAVSDAEASQILSKSLGFGGQRLEAEKEYVAQLKKILPTEQVLRAYQIETKLNALYLAVMFDTVPLAR
ncbi:MAG TPA: hypothetical protein VMH37_17920 [Candidatus Binataceae bacterium]|nr:hypothetical protein [Candidatus Binataceae bacterium]